MKIAFVTDQVYLHGGIEKVLSQKANYLADVLGDEVIIITYAQKGNLPCYPFSNKIQFLDLGVAYQEGISYFHPKNLRQMPSHRAKLRAALKSLKPDVLVSCNFGPDFYFLPFIEKGIPKVKEFHGSRYFYEQQAASVKDKFLRRLGSRAEAAFDAIAVLNQDEIPFYTNKNLVVLPNPTERSPAQSTVKSKRVLAAGRISPVKNFGELIDIWSLVAKRFPDWELHFYGEDYLGTKAKLENQIKHLNLGSSVKFMGVTHSMRTTMLDYSLYALSSETECFPMVLLESLSMGLPSVCYDVPTGPKFIIRDGEDGFLVPNKNKVEFAEKMMLLMNEENLRRTMGEAAAKNAERFEISRVMQSWKDLLQGLVVGKSLKRI